MQLKAAEVSLGKVLAFSSSSSLAEESMEVLHSSLGMLCLLTESPGVAAHAVKLGAIKECLHILRQPWCSRLPDAGAFVSEVLIVLSNLVEVLRGVEHTTADP